MNSELSGKVAIVTGGASGIGRATVTGLLRQGAAVAVLDRDESEGKAVADEGQRNGDNAVAFIVDLADTKQIPGIVDRVITHFGRIDILVNCAGVAGNRQSLVDLEEAEWDFIHTVNLKASMLMMRYVARHIIDRGGGGRIVNLSSSSAFRARQSAIAYATSKAAIVQLTRSAAAELGRYNINVNAIPPGITDTAMTRAIRDAEGLRQTASSGPLENLFHRVSMPEDVAAAIIFLCLPSSRQITAQTIHTSAGAVII